MDLLVKSIEKWRRELHQIPELGLEEYKTTDYLERELISMGYKCDRILETGLVVFIDYKQNETIAFRSDIDALRVDEKTNCDYTSLHDGLMHACGHDGHMATLLGLAKYLKDSNQRTFSKNILLIFQPAEESPGAARLLMEKGIKDKYNLVEIYGMHLMPSIDEGIIACKSGPLMSECGELYVTVHGKDAHVGLYHKGIDSIMITTLLINQYQLILSRQVDPLENALIHVGKIQGGTTGNSVAAKTSVVGTLRTFDEKLFVDITTKMKKINKAFEEAYGVKVDFHCEPMYPPVINDDNLYNKFVLLGFKNYQELKRPLMLGEDFSFYQREIPGIFFFLGTKTEEYASGLHTDTFNFNEAVLMQGLEVYLKIIDQIK